MVARRGSCLWLVLASVGEAALSSRHAPASLLASNPADSSTPPPPGSDQSALLHGSEGQAGYPFVSVTAEGRTVPPPVSGSLCDDAVIPHSNRTAEFPCKDYYGPGPYQGTECFFKCDPGYMPIGRHVCQWHDPDWVRSNDKHFPEEDDPKAKRPEWATAKMVHELEDVPPKKNYRFWGGTCAPMCGDNPATHSCPAGQSPRRYKESTLTQSVSDENDCMETECFPTARDNLRSLARASSR